MKYVFPEYKENVVLGNGKLQLNPMSYQVIYEGKEIDLTPREFEVLYCMLLIPKRSTLLYAMRLKRNYLHTQMRCVNEMRE